MLVFSLAQQALSFLQYMEEMYPDYPWPIDSVPVHIPSKGQEIQNSLSKTNFSQKAFVSPPPQSELDRFKTYNSLPELAAAVSSCSLCPLNHKKHFFGRGRTEAPILFITDPPTTEDRENNLCPSGPAGELLDRMIRGGLKMVPEDLYITPYLKCPARDPQNLPLGALDCLQILKREISLARPKVVLCLGAGASRFLLESKLSIPFGLLKYKSPSLPGHNDIPLRMTWSLNDMLTEPVLKKEVFRDLLAIVDYLDKKNDLKAPF